MGLMTFEVIPSIDVRGGRCVRLVRGDFEQETVFADDPLVIAENFLEQGARRIHIVDLDSARGSPDPQTTQTARALVRRLADAACIAQVGGGVRSRDAAERWFADGAELVVVGSLALRAPDIAAEICGSFPGQVLLALDVRDSAARADGWLTDAGPAIGHLDVWRAWPAAGLIYTDTQRDGTLQGPNLEGLDLCRSVFTGPVYVSGGIRSLTDITACADVGAAGVIVGSAVYQSRIDLREILRSSIAGTA